MKSVEIEDEDIEGKLWYRNNGRRWVSIIYSYLLGLEEVRRRGAKCDGGVVTLAESVPTFSNAC